METADSFQWFTDEAEAHARFLVQRMVNARTAMLRSAEDELSEQLMRKILSKLVNGPLDRSRLL
ncbi:MAG: hypothetical protein RLZZ214_2828 [Verrucomicrobiota bacterium]|jgi:hypothetical protein